MDYQTLFESIAQECSGLLNISAEHISGDSNFFNLGGSSVTALQLCTQIECKFPELFDDEGIDISKIATEPNLKYFTLALLEKAESSGSTMGEI